ncbi:MAG: hypothetical protein COA49_02635 [Bacteroidetes bacterium]|nr:MAG: hypothetical protein COA49_03690 [Bacteroidota bacterium]PCJ81878.1 MAG: hypothetical protein COA49_02635 [Bacteroidota bacterium]
MIRIKPNRSLFILPLVLSLILGIVSKTSLGQWSDYGVWSSVSCSQNLSDDLSYSASAATRVGYDFTRVESVFSNVSISRKLTPIAKGLKLDASIRLGMSKTSTYLWQPIRRLSASIKWKFDLSENMTFSSRVRYQTASKGLLATPASHHLRSAARFKTGLTYSVSKKLRLGLYTEFFSRPQNLGWYYSDHRMKLVVNVKTAKRRWASFGYQVEQQKNTPDPWTEHRIICGFDLEMKQRKAEK